MDDPIHPPSPLPGYPDELPDIMNDPAFAPPQRNASVYGSESGSALGGDTCRICRSEGSPDEPLFYPCKCSGSIKFVHQECLMEWLSHSHKKHCELCKTPFRFTKLYDPDMPLNVPLSVFILRASIHIAQLLMRACRATLVAVVWLVFLPWLIRWAWRWMFWFADAGWAREAFMRKMHAQHVASQAQEQGAGVAGLNHTSSVSDTLYATLGQLLAGQKRTSEDSPPRDALGVISDALTAAFKNATATTSSDNTTFFWPQADASILSSWTYISEISPNPQVNRVILDIFEGQLITCVVITGFILVFLIREWVVQQQPLVHLDNLNNAQRERDRILQEREQLHRQIEFLDQARERLTVLQNESGTASSTGDTSVPVEFQGWEGLHALIDAATDHLRNARNGRDEAGYEKFALSAIEALRQVHAAEGSGIDVSEMADKIYEKLATLTEDERQAWEDILVSELRQLDSKKVQATHGASQPTEQASDDLIDHAEGSSGLQGRPPMPNRETSSRATQIQRILEEADTAFSFNDRHSSGGLSPRSTAAEPGTESASMVSAPSTESSWQDVGPANEAGEVIDHVDIFPENNDEIPITNAGPDAKINIKRSGKGKAKAIVPEPKAERKPVSDEELSKKVENSVVNTDTHVARSEGQDVLAPEPEEQENVNAGNPFHPDGTVPEEPENESLRDRMASAFREEFGLDQADLEEAEEVENLRQAGLDPSGQPLGEEPSAAETNRVQAQNIHPSILQLLADWFWGDIQAQGAPEPAIAPNEELMGIGDENQQAPFVPVPAVQPLLDAVPHDEQHPQDNDPEVVAAAQQAGLDAEAVEDAEDLEGIFELIGLQGPLIGLFQTSCFCSVLVTGTVFGAVGLPYVWGKLVLSFIGAPLTFAVKTPLQVTSFIADLLIDITLLIGGWLTVVTALAVDLLFSAVEAWAPTMVKYNASEWVSEVATTAAAAAGHRLSNMFVSSETAGAGVESLGWNWALLGASVHAHASLKTLETEVNSVLNYTGNTITSVAETVSSGSATLVWQRSLNALAHLPQIPAKILAGIYSFQRYTQPLMDVMRSMKSGELTFASERTQLDPSLVYWSSNDRGLAVLTGYVALAAIAAVYVALDRPITRSQSGQKTEKIIRDTLRQAGGVLKVILIISIEMLVFPLYCGLLLDLAFLPLFHSASVATRWAFAMRSPYTFCFVHWFVGTCYMFHFALFVGMCRKILRRGVLWFIRDPDDPTFHPVRDVLERNVTTQLRKIAFSALVYGALVILCLGGVIWSIGRIFKGIFPIHWASTEPVLEFPLDLVLYNFLTPLVLRLANPSGAVNAMYAWWLRRCARVLRLSHFLFDDRRKDEEGRHVRKSWRSFLLLKKGDIDDNTKQITASADAPDVYFKRDGKYVLTPCNDQYRPPKPGEAFLHMDDDDVYIVDKDGKKNDHFAPIYVPPYFRLRVTLFMVCLWIFSAFTGLCATLVPLVFGRTIFYSFLPHGVRVNDIYAYSAGAYILGTAVVAAFKGSSLVQSLREKAHAVDFKAWIKEALRYGTQAGKCVYVYGFAGLFLPLVFALVLQLYIILPLHTYAATILRPALQAALNNGTVNAFNATELAANVVQNATAQASSQQHLPGLADHTIHILADHALCLIYLRIAIRWIVTSPTSRAAEAVRRITKDGYLNPDVRLATRYFIVPATLFFAAILLVPFGMAKLTIGISNFVARYITFVGAMDSAARTIVYRYAYPLSAACVLVSLGTLGIVKVAGRWRARIKDEVYLVGERLHNFGEKRPPSGSKSVVRKDK